MDEFAPSGKKPESVIPVLVSYTGIDDRWIFYEVFALDDLDRHYMSMPFKWEVWAEKTLYLIRTSENLKQDYVQRLVNQFHSNKNVINVDLRKGNVRR